MTAKKRKPIRIKPSKKGSFTRMAKKAGKSVQGEASEVLASPTASPAAKKKANFARNAASWNHSGPRKKTSKKK
jgi:hypothetical protein